MDERGEHYVSLSLSQLSYICKLLWSGNPKDVENARRLLVNSMDAAMRHEGTSQPEPVSTQINIKITANVKDALEKLTILNHEILTITNNLEKIEGGHRD